MIGAIRSDPPNLWAGADLRAGRSPRPPLQPAAPGGQMAELPILPIKTDAILADTGHLSAEEMGAYCRILFTMWRHGARLPNDPVELARIAGISPRKWSTIGARVMRLLIVGTTEISQKRLTATWLEVQEVRAKKAEAAGARWRNHRTSKNKENSDASALQMDSTCNANQIKSIDILPSISPFRPPQKSKSIKPAGSLASALPSGALARPPASKPTTS